MNDSQPKIEIVPATLEQESILAGLLELYAEDFREFYKVPMGPGGRFIYEKLPLYWTEEGRYPFLVMVDAEVAGFVLVKRGSEVSGDPDVWDVAEFFVVREARRRGVGTEVARLVWDRFPGRWEVRVMEGNQRAAGFWSHATAEFAGREVGSDQLTKDEKVWRVFSFAAK